jgi:hypothetical protein
LLVWTLEGRATTITGLFSKRFKTALDKKTIPYPSFLRVLRKRLLKTCSKYSVEWQDFGTYYSTESEVIDALRMAYGKDRLVVKDDPNSEEREATGFEDYFMHTYPHNVLDALEAFYRCLDKEIALVMQEDINAVLLEENSPWIMSDGQMFMIDNHFLDSLKERALSLMQSEGYWGAYNEINEARSHLMAGSIDVAIHKANCAFESTLKSILGKYEGTAQELTTVLAKETDILENVPESVKKVITKNILSGLPALRHKIGGHGQGEKPVSAPRAYGELAINLAVAYIKFLTDLKGQLKITTNEEDINSSENDDVPF